MEETALYYAEKGYPVFPLTPGGKVPLIARRNGGRGCHDATTDKAQIRHWWSREPQANIGIATGRKSGLIVVDVDMKDGRDGQASIHTMTPVPTYTVRTPSRGFHLYYAMPSGVRITVGTNVLPGVDYRGEGGYVVAAGSSTDQGWYEIARALPIAPLPRNILELLTTRGPATVSPLRPFSSRQWAKDQPRVAAALAYLDPSDYDTWIAAGAAIHLASHGAAVGFALWQSWSEGGLTGDCPANFGGVEDCQRRWQSFGNANRDREWRPVTLGTVFRLARLHGFESGTTSQGAA